MKEARNRGFEVRFWPSIEFTHHARKFVEHRPICARTVEVFPKVARPIRQQHVVAEHVVRGVEANHLLVHHQCDLFEKADEVASILDRDLPY